MKFLGIIFLASQLVGATLVPGTEDTYEQGGYRWDGNPFCYDAGLFPSHVQVQTDDGATVWADSVGACRNLRAASIVPPAPGTLEIQ